jgi:hypothetical protein
MVIYTHRCRQSIPDELKQEDMMSQPYAQDAVTSFGVLSAPCAAYHKGQMARVPKEPGDIS